MKIISFAKTTPALLAGRKTVTRRQWTARHAATFHAGDLCQAWDHVPRVKGAKRVGTIRLTADPQWEPEGTPIGPPEYEHEGFMYLLEEQALPRELEELWARWLGRGSDGLWVVRFELVEREAEATEEPMSAQERT